MTTIKLIYRKKKKSFNSIENVFDALFPYLGCNVEKIELPYESNGLIKRIKNIWFVRKIAKNSVVHITGYDHYLAMGLRKKSTILTVHDIEFLKRNRGVKKYLLKKLWLDWPINSVKMVTTVSEFSKKEILSIRNYNTPIHVIHNPLTLPIQIKLKNFNSLLPNILHIGTKPNKNLPRLIKALNGIKCHLTIIGDIELGIKNLLAINNINYTSKTNLSNREIVQQYEICDMLAFVSIYEGFGLPIIEAQAIGRPVITSNIASMPEIAGNSALIVSPYDVDEIRNGIIELIKNEPLRNKLINQGFENVNRYKPQEIANQYIGLYKKMLND